MFYLINYLILCCIYYISQFVFMLSFKIFMHIPSFFFFKFDGKCNVKKKKYNHTELLLESTEVLRTSSIYIQKSASKIGQHFILQTLKKFAKWSRRQKNLYQIRERSRKLQTKIQQKIFWEKYLKNHQQQATVIEE